MSDSNKPDDDATIERQIVEDVFKEYGLIPEYIEKKVDENGKVLGWIPHFSPEDLKFMLTEKGKRFNNK